MQNCIFYFMYLQVSQLIILNDSAEREGGKLPNLVPFAQQVLRATEDLGQVGQTLVQQSRDEVQYSPVVMPQESPQTQSEARFIVPANVIQIFWKSWALLNSCKTLLRRFLKGQTPCLLLVTLYLIFFLFAGVVFWNAQGVWPDEVYRTQCSDGCSKTTSWTTFWRS